MKRNTVDVLLELAPLILRAMDLVELLYRGVTGSSEAKRALVADRVTVDPEWPGWGHGVYYSDVGIAIDRAVLWNNAAGWTHLDAYDTKFELAGTDAPAV